MADEDREFGPLEDQNIKNVVLQNRESMIENSVDINANMTDMNLVANDQTNIQSNLDLHQIS